MPKPHLAILAEIIRIGNSPIGDKTVLSLRKLHFQVMEFADSLTSKGSSVESREDFEEVLNDLTEQADSLEEACDDCELADDSESREQALEAAGEALKDLGVSINEIAPLSEYIESTNETVAARWATELSRLPTLPTEKFRPALDSLLDQARTPKESSILIALAKSAVFTAHKSP